MQLGPVDCLVVEFPGNNFRGEIAPALAALVNSGTIRILDLTFVRKDADGDVTYFELDDLDPVDVAGFDDVDGTISGLLNRDDIAQVADALAPDSSAALLVWENTWAARITTAIADADGRVAAFERIPADVAEAALLAVASHSGA
ncbi:DUF6325 family protein [Yinghuangia seranimata]|uniref:DUF6325 family protein n=1 Tax=Yinghuangia seranimata TaxID=408067 RepID=UPI00248AB0F0|nr:DUF6325 family protein [Yinghuangia seranimata]MDI2129974.1 DUF6325 family protein [Yinghuangia seranimata]